MVSHAYNTRIWEVETGGSEVKVIIIGYIANMRPVWGIGDHVSNKQTIYACCFGYNNRKLRPREKKQCWRDGSLCKVPALEACGPELDLPEPTPKRQVCWCMHVIPTLERQGQKNSWNSLASRFSLIGDKFSERPCFINKVRERAHTLSLSFPPPLHTWGNGRGS